MTVVLRRLFLSLLTLLAAIPLFLPISVPGNKRPGTPAPADSITRHSVKRLSVSPRETQLEAQSQPTPPELVIEVIGRQFCWHFHCLQPEAVQSNADNKMAREELHLPAGSRVEFRFTSEDYIYLCKIPEIGITEIAVPGLTHQCVRDVVVPGSYDMRVDPLCGFRFYHDELMGRIVVEKNLRIEQLTEST